MNTSPASVAHPASYRDPAGRVYLINGRILRSVTEAGRADFEWVEQSGLAEGLCAVHRLSPYRRVDPATLGAPLNEAAYVLEHEAIPFISHPYEWSFSLLKAAALHHLDLHLECLERDVTLSDASAYNIQFNGVTPCFIDRLSLIRYREGMPWRGHTQFCEQFLAPLLLHARGFPCNALYRGGMEGVPLAAAAQVLPVWRKASLRYLLHVGLPLMMEGRGAAGGGNGRAAVPKSGTRFLLRQLRAWVAGLSGPARRGVWGDYEAQCISYDEETRRKKRDAVAACIVELRPKTVWDMGCNSGEYARLALENGAGRVIGFDSDLPALEKAYAGAREQRLSFLPLYMDAGSPSPSQGWGQAERQGLMERKGADFLMALALLHHLVISRLVPLAEAVAWLVSLAPCGAIEWIGQEDAMVQAMLSARARRFEEYTEPNFQAALTQHASIIRAVPLSAGRTLYVYRAKGL